MYSLNGEYVYADMINQIIELNQYCKMIHGCELNQIIVNNGDLTDMTESNIKIKDNFIRHNIECLLV